MNEKQEISKRRSQIRVKKRDKVCERTFGELVRWGT